MYKDLKKAVISLGMVAALVFVFAPSASANEKALHEKGGVQMNQENPTSMSWDVNSNPTGGNAFFRAESGWHPYQFGNESVGKARGYYAENNNEAMGPNVNYDKLLPRTPYTSPKRWLP